MADKIDQITIGSTSYDIDLPPDATPSISSLTVSGTTDVSSGTLKLSTINAPTSSGGTTYGPGTSGQVLKSNGTTMYWASDSNTTTTYGTLAYYFRPYVGTQALYRYKFVMLDKDNRLVPLTITDVASGTAVTNQTPTNVAFRPEKIWWYNVITPVNAGSVIGVNTLTSIGYNANDSLKGGMAICNFNSTISKYRMIYLCGTYDKTTGLFTLRDGGIAGSTQYYVQVPTNTANITLSSYFTSGYDYILLGGTYSTDNYMHLMDNNPMYHFDGTNLVPYDTYKVARTDVSNTFTTNQIMPKISLKEDSYSVVDISASSGFDVGIGALLFKTKADYTKDYYVKIGFDDCPYDYGGDYSLLIDLNNKQTIAILPNEDWTTGDSGVATELTLPANSGTLALTSDIPTNVAKTNIDNNFSTNQTFKDITMYAASGDSPRIIFQRGTLTDTYNDWSLYDSSGYLYIQQRGSSSSVWETRATFTQSGVNFAGTISENGTSLANKYVDKTTSQTINGTKTFNSAPIITNPTPTSTTITPGSTSSISGVYNCDMSVSTFDALYNYINAHTSVTVTQNYYSPSNLTSISTYTTTWTISTSPAGSSYQSIGCCTTTPYFYLIKIDSSHIGIYTYSSTTPFIVYMGGTDTTLYETLSGDNVNSIATIGQIAEASSPLYEHNILITYNDSTSSPKGKCRVRLKVINRDSTAFTGPTLATFLYPIGYGPMIPASGKLSYLYTANNVVYTRLYDVIGIGSFTTNNLTALCFDSIKIGEEVNGVLTLNSNSITNENVSISTLGGTTTSFSITDKIRTLE